MDSTPEKTSDVSFPPAVLAALSAGLILALFNHFLRPLLPPEHQWIAIVLFAVGFLTFLAGAWGVDQKRLPFNVDYLLQKLGSWLGIHPGQVLALLFSLFFAMTTTLAAGFNAKMYSMPVAVISWGSAIAMMIIAGWERKPLCLTKVKPAFLWGAGLLLLAFLLRGVDTTHIPIVLSGDEASAGLFSVNFLRGLTDNLFNVGWFSFPSFFFYLQTFALAVFGQTTVALRITAAVAGAISVFAFYFVVRGMYGQRMAVIAAVFLAFSHFHINFSRIALNNIWDALGYIACLGALWYGWQKQRRAAFILSGLALGFSQYFYTSTRGLFIIVPLFILLVALQDRQRFKRMIPNFVLMFLAAVVVVLPLAWFFVTHPSEFNAPMQRVSILGEWLQATIRDTGKPGWRVMGEQLLASFLAFTDVPSRAWYTPGTPLLRPASAFLFYIGLAFMIIRIKDNRTWLLLLWLGIFGVTGAFSESTPAAQRYVAAIPAAMIVVALGVDKLMDIGNKLLSRWQPWVYCILMILAVLFAVDDSRFYFFDYTPNSEFSGFHGQVAQHFANYLQDYDTSWEVIFIGWPDMGYYSISSLPFLAPQIKGVDYFQPWGHPDNPLPDYDNVMFVFLPNHAEELAKCQEQYPGGKLTTAYNERHEMLYYLYKLEGLPVTTPES